MTMIDHAIEDVAGRFGLGPKSGQLMQEVVRLITGSPGGVIGFIGTGRGEQRGSRTPGGADGARCRGALAQTEQQARKAAAAAAHGAAAGAKALFSGLLLSLAGAMVGGRALGASLTERRQGEPADAAQNHQIFR